MKKYFDPQMTISAFEMKNIVTTSGTEPAPAKPALVDGLADVTETTVNVSLNDIMITM